VPPVFFWCAQIFGTTLAAGSHTLKVWWDTTPGSHQFMNLDNLTVTYTTNVSQTSQQIIQVQYNLTRNVSLLALRDYNGVVSFEVRIRQRKK